MMKVSRKRKKKGTRKHSNSNNHSWLTFGLLCVFRSFQINSNFLIDPSSTRIFFTFCMKDSRSYVSTFLYFRWKVNDENFPPGKQLREIIDRRWWSNKFQDRLIYRVLQYILLTWLIFKLFHQMKRLFISLSLSFFPSSFGHISFLTANFEFFFFFFLRVRWKVLVSFMNFCNLRDFLMFPARNENDWNGANLKRLSNF